MKHLTRENRYLKPERRKQLIHETCLVIFFQNISKEKFILSPYSFHAVLPRKDLYNLIAKNAKGST